MRPVRLAPNLVEHFYRGGDKIAALRGIRTSSDHQPEEWIAATIARAQLTPSNLVAASTSGSLSAIKYTKVGSTGSYDQVTDIIPGTFPTCDANPFCITQPKQISGESPVSAVRNLALCPKA